MWTILGILPTCRRMGVAIDVVRWIQNGFPISMTKCFLIHWVNTELLLEANTSIMMSIKRRISGFNSTTPNLMYWSTSFVVSSPRTSSSIKFEPKPVLVSKSTSTTSLAVKHLVQTPAVEWRLFASERIDCLLLSICVSVCVTVFYVQWNSCDLIDLINIKTVYCSQD